MGFFQIVSDETAMRLNIIALVAFPVIAIHFIVSISGNLCLIGSGTSLG